jgi:hypothetical protein
VSTTSHPETNVVTGFEIALTLPPGFPAKWRAGIAKAVGSCKVKKTIAAVPTFTVLVDDA